MNTDDLGHACKTFDQDDSYTEMDFSDSAENKPIEFKGLVSAVPYLDTTSYDMGVKFEDLEEIKNKMYKSQGCMKTAHQFEGYKTRAEYHKFFACGKWWCPDCGKKGGYMHKKRMARIIKKIGTPLKDLVLKQHVYTIPEELEQDFFKKKALNSLVKMAEKISMKICPGLRAIAALQLFGDRDRGRYRPHVHILMLDKKGCRLILPKEKLDLMRLKWKQALTGFMGQPVKAPDVHASFSKEPRKIKHMIKYVSRPCPGVDNLDAMKKDLNLMTFVMNVLQNFRYIRYFGPGWKGSLKDQTIGDDLRESISLAGEKLIFCPGKQMTRSEFDLRYKPWDYDELSPGFYRIKTPE